MGNDIKQCIAQNLREIRKSRNISIEFMADMLNTTSGSIQNYLYGRSLPSVEFLCDVCNKFSVIINPFFGDLIPESNDFSNICIISDSFVDISPVRQTRLRKIIEPFVVAVIESNPQLYRIDFGQRVRIIREDGGISMSEFSDNCHIAVNTLKNIESSQRLPSVSLLLQICNTFHVSPEYMLIDYLEHPSVDRALYALTPRQLKALAETVQRLCTLGD